MPIRGRKERRGSGSDGPRRLGEEKVLRGRKGSPPAREKEGKRRIIRRLSSLRAQARRKAHRVHFYSFLCPYINSCRHTGFGEGHCEGSEGRGLGALSAALESRVSHAYPSRAKTASGSHAYPSPDKPVVISVAAATLIRAGRRRPYPDKAATISVAAATLIRVRISHAYPSREKVAATLIRVGRAGARGRWEGGGLGTLGHC